MALSYLFFIWYAAVLHDVEMVFPLWDEGFGDLKRWFKNRFGVGFGVLSAFLSVGVDHMQIAGSANTSLVRIDVVLCERIIANSADLFFVHVYFTVLVITVSTE